MKTGCKLRMMFGVVLAMVWASLSGQTFRVVYFDALSIEDEKNIKKLFYSLHEEYPGGTKFEVQNFYDDNLTFQVQFGKNAFSRPPGMKPNKEKKFAPKTKPRFRFTGIGNLQLSSQPQNDIRPSQGTLYEERNAGDRGELIVVWDLENSQSLDKSILIQKLKRPSLTLYQDDFKAGDWDEGYKGYEDFYDGKGLLTRSFVKALDKKLNAAKPEFDRQAEVRFIYCNSKVVSEFSCESIESELSRAPDSFRIHHNYEEDYSTTLRPVNGKYSLALRRSETHDVFVGFRVRIEVATGQFQGQQFELAQLEIGSPTSVGSIREVMGDYDLNLEVEWLGSECLRVSGAEYADPDCECREECLYQKDFFVSIQGIGDSTCEAEFPWSSPMKISFQCEK